ncbi:MAG: terminase large subunit domain-containing protein [Psychrobacter sp.]
MQLTIPQTEIFTSPARFRTVVAGRRFGKTFLSTIEILRAAVGGKNRNVWYIAPTYGSAKEIAWNMLIHTIPEEYIAKTNESSLVIKLINGSSIALKGAEKPNNLRGRALDFVVLDEFADMKPETWSEVIRPSLSDRQGSCIFIGTPKGRNHFYDIWADALTGKDNWESYQYTTIDGGNVPAEEIEQARMDLDERTFNQEYCAEFVTYSGLIYYAFSRELSVINVDDNDGTLHIGMDFNLDPMSAVICLRHGQDLLAIDEIVMYGSNTDEMVAEIKDRYPNRHCIIYPDPASRQRKTSAGGRTDLSILQNAGFSVKAKKAHPLVRDRINAVNSRLLSGDGDRHLFVSPKCKQTIKSLERQTYKEGTSIPNKDGTDHMNDALGYLVEYLFPIRTEYNTPQPTRWT